MEHLAVIGGSGLYQIEGLQNIEQISVTTPFGDPSDKIIKGDISGRTIFFLPRHGINHTIPPEKVNFRANIYALKSLGVTRIVSVSAVGSMKEDIKPGDMVIVDQFIDRTTGRISTFFDKDMVAHVSLAEPTCKELSTIVYKAAVKVTPRTHIRGTYVCINGPQFSTRAESHLYRSWNVDVIGMTNIPEAKLAREAEMCYATLALATDYDCWRENEDEDVNASDVVKIIKQNVENSKKIILEIVRHFPETANCTCKNALQFAIMTNKKVVSKNTLENLDILIKKYIQ